MKVVDFIEKGGSRAAASKQFGITIRTIFNWIKRKELGCLASSGTKQPISRKIDDEKLKTYLVEHPHAHLKEIAEAFNASVTGVFYACRRIDAHQRKFPGRKYTRLIRIDSKGKK